MKTKPTLSSFLPPARLTLMFGLAAAIGCGNALLANPGKGKGNGGGNKNDNNGKAVGQSADFVPPGHRRQPVEIEVKQAPPAIRVEVAPPRPSALHVWVPGFWNWQASAYVWTPAVWMLPPEPAAQWVQPRFETRTGIHVFITGYWRI